VTSKPSKWLRLVRRLRPRRQNAALDGDRQIVVFPTAASRVSGKEAWEISVDGWVFEFIKRPVLARVLRRVVRREWRLLSEKEREIAVERAAYFFAAPKRGRTIVVRLGDAPRRLRDSKRGGHFHGNLHFDGGAATDGARPGSARFEVWDQADPDRRFDGLAFLPSRDGLSVVSDIDDTIKLTGVTERAEMLRNTFCRPFRAVAGMAALYQSWAREPGVVFHYVSASPWQLYPLIAGFLQEHGFPPGTFHLRRVRLKDGSFLRLFAPPILHKRAAVESLLRRYPRRRFALVGDSGERDPEIYGDLARRWPARIAGVFIRDSDAEPAPVARYAAAFRDVSPGLWRVFRDPAELADFRLR
jgi:hypothetical protein